MPNKWQTYAELLRLPAAFTSLADVMMGFLVTHGNLRPISAFALLSLISTALYLAGMVLNDVFDAEIDAHNRPKRPIPSGRVPLDHARRLGWTLLAGGVCAANFASLYLDDWRPGFIGALLTGCILLYDAVHKRSPWAPLIMGGCRTLNVLLGMSLATSVRWPFEPRAWTPSEWAIAIGIGVYIAGVTWFARGEAGASHRGHLLGGVAVMLAGLLVLGIAGRFELRAAKFVTEQDAWPLLWFALALVILGRSVLAVVRPEPERVQTAVRNSLRALIVLDATIVLDWAGPWWALAVLALLVPMLILERWFSTT